MIDIQVCGSSSKGNCYVLTDNGSSIMLEAGISPRQLSKQGVKLSKIDALLITHEHGDHTKYAKDLLLSTKCDIWASASTLEFLDINRRCHHLKASNEQRIGKWVILPFDTIHDDEKVRAREPLGFFILTPSGQRVVFATDTNFIKGSFPKVNYWMIECNHDVQLVRKSSYPKFLQDRIIKTHMSIDSCKEFFKRANMDYTKHIYLLHLSDSNSEPSRFKKEIEDITGKPVSIA
ncbi:MBL fold metallo-hydrolase [Enterococcus sp.]|uniref:MBL fold metallo-hydrolase n=1 Tax=Enterococcus sp. TaxID=35783 RepID=UPI002897933E|nr:MBL fold metallo-hydrolase [Enterococcus sp.]